MNSETELSVSRLSRLHGNKHGARQARVLVVDDSRSILNLLCAYLSHVEGIVPVKAGSLAEAKRHLAESADFMCAVLDLNLPDAPNGEIVDLVAAKDIPVIVLTGSVDEALRETMLKKQVLDYVIKRNANEIEHVAYIVGRLLENSETTVLVVDDSPSFRRYLVALLEHYRFHVLSADNGEQALKVVEQHPELTLVITDFHMPGMNGQQLTQRLRENYRREDLAIIGLSDGAKTGLSAMLLKSGANDFLNKPFEVEEFYCRVTQNTNMISYVRQVRDSATRDFLTKLYNRRHLFELGETLYANAKRGDICLAAALIDADHFKRINDNFGHQVGDQALKLIADTLVNTLRKSDVVARYGGEEFVCLAIIKRPQDAPLLFERVRAALQAIDLRAADEQIPITASIGVTLDLAEDLDAMLNKADEAVYQAKEAGRNRVVIN